MKISFGLNAGASRVVFSQSIVLIDTANHASTLCFITFLRKSGCQFFAKNALACKANNEGFAVLEKKIDLSKRKTHSWIEFHKDFSIHSRWILTQLIGTQGQLAVFCKISSLPVASKWSIGRLWHSYLLIIYLTALSIFEKWRRFFVKNVTKQVTETRFYFD